MTALESEIEAIVRRVVREEIAKSREAPPPSLVSIADFARSRSISTSTVRAAIREKRLAITRIGRLVRIASDAKILPHNRTEQRDRARLKLMGGTVR